MSSTSPLHHATLLGLTLIVILLATLPVQADTVDVSIQGFAFDPDSVTISVGTTVRWTNLDAALHTSTSDDGVWDSGNLNTNDQFTFTFDSSATYPYHCEIHPAMTATIIVEEEQVPLLTPYGLVVLLVLLAASAIWVLHKRGVARVKR